MWLLGLGMAFSLLADSTLYVVLPTRAAQAGILLADVGLMLSVNRVVRIFLNSPYGMLIERVPRRRVLVPSLFLGAAIASLYTIPGFVPMLVGRALWGIAWAGIWLGGSTAVLDLARDADRGNLVGRFQMWLFIGLGAGALLGGALTDWLGYRNTFLVFALVNLIVALGWWVMLPETRPERPSHSMPGARPPEASPSPPLRGRAPLVVATVLLGLNWLVFLGALGAILSLLLQQRVGDNVNFAGIALPLATFAGAVAATNQALSLLSAPLSGWFSDRRGNRWGMVVFALALGIAALVVAAEGAGVVVVAGLLLGGVATSVLQTQVITLAGDYSAPARQGRVLGVFNAVGDLGAAAGPLLAFALLPLVDLRGVCLLSAAALALVLPWTLWLAWREVRVARVRVASPP